jgi:CubicO group peptidase (beta-lactamase class C family)
MSEYFLYTSSRQRHNCSCIQRCFCISLFKRPCLCAWAEELCSQQTPTANTSFAIQASIGNTTVFQYEYSAPGREANQSLFDTKIRIASATKLITALALELSKDNINLDDSITKFIPELIEEVYGDVTIKSLADHTSGLGRFESSNTTSLILPAN